MKGLLIKDLLLIKNQKRTLPLLLCCGIIMAGTSQATIAIVYLTILCAMVCAGTISYDEFDHGFPFLFTLPVTRKEYAREKYLLSGVCCLAALLLGVALCLGIEMAKGTFDAGGTDRVLSGACGAFLAAAIMLGVAIPVRLKYGSEKGAIAMYVIFGLLAAIAVLALRGKDFLPPSVVNAIGQKLATMSTVGAGVVLPVIILVSVLLLCISEQITERIMVRKEY